jgi:hypothetical protein
MQIINLVTDNESEDLMTFPLSDFLRPLKGVRTQLLPSYLSLDAWTVLYFTGDDLARDLKSNTVREILGAKSDFDRGNDHLALETFALENLLRL